MLRISTIHPGKHKNIMALAVLLAVSGGVALAAQDRFTLQVPNGLAFSDFKGYETWQDVAVSQTEESLKAISANNEMIDAYRQGVPGDGKLFPDGSKIVKIEWGSTKSSESPYFVMVPDILKTLSFIKKIPRDSRIRTDGRTRSLPMTPRPTRSSRMATTPNAAMRAIRLSLLKILSSRPIPSAERRGRRGWPTSGMSGLVCLTNRPQSSGFHPSPAPR